MKITSPEAKEAILIAIDEKMAIAELEPLGLSIRTITGLEDKLGIIYLEELLKLTLAELKAVKNLGTQAVKEVEVALNQLHTLTDKLKKKHTIKVAPLIGQAVSMRTHQAAKTPAKVDGAGRIIE